MLAAGCTTIIGGQLHRGFVQSASASLRSTPAGAGVSTLQQRSDIPEEQIWLDKEKSARTRRAYRLDVQHLMRTLSITTGLKTGHYSAGASLGCSSCYSNFSIRAAHTANSALAFSTARS
jgi:hypothetical protein